jgi:hypothetical protein
VLQLLLHLQELLRRLIIRQVLVHHRHPNRVSTSDHVELEIRHDASNTTNLANQAFATAPHNIKLQDIGIAI